MAMIPAIPLSKGRLTPDELDPIHAMRVRLLLAAVNGEVDLNLIARQELANRGYDRAGVWVGFSEARACYEREREQTHTPPPRVQEESPAD